MGGVSAEKLHPERSLAWVKVEVFASTLVAAKDAFGGNEFGDENVCAIALTDLAENLIGHTRHRREVEREGILEPGERGIHQDIVPQNRPNCRWMGAKNDEARMTKDRP